MRIAIALLLLAPILPAQDAVLDLKVYLGSYDAKGSGSVIVSLPEGKLTPLSGPGVAEEIMRTFQLKTMDLVSAPRIATPVGTAATVASAMPDGAPVRTVQATFQPISMDKETAHVSLQFSANGKAASGAELIVRPGRPFTLSSRLDGHLMFLIGILNPMAPTGELPPRVVKKEAPAYPEDLKNDKVQGIAVMKLRIDQQGEVLKCEKIRADDDRFVAPACEAALRWEFEPARKDGKPIPSDYTITLAFRIQ
jgi:TonB family protein